MSPKITGKKKYLKMKVVFKLACLPVRFIQNKLLPRHFITSGLVWGVEEHLVKSDLAVEACLVQQTLHHRCRGCLTRLLS